jgi:hypothetical protein
MRTVVCHPNIQTMSFDKASNDAVREVHHVLLLPPQFLNQICHHVCLLVHEVASDRSHKLERSASRTRACPTTSSIEDGPVSLVRGPRRPRVSPRSPEQ